MMLLLPLDEGEYIFGGGDEIVYDGINRQTNTTGSAQAKTRGLWTVYRDGSGLKNSIVQDDRFGNQPRRNTSRNISFYEDFSNVARRNWNNSIPYYLPAVREIVSEFGENVILPDDYFGGLYNINVDFQKWDLFGDEILSPISRDRGNQTKQVFTSVIRGFGYEPVDFYINRWEGKDPSYQTYLGSRGN